MIIHGENLLSRGVRGKEAYSGDDEAMLSGAEFRHRENISNLNAETFPMYASFRIPGIFTAHQITLVTQYLHQKFSSGYQDF